MWNQEPEVSFFPQINLLWLVMFDSLYLDTRALEVSSLKYQSTFPIILDSELDEIFSWTGPTGLFTAGLPYAPVIS